MFTSSGSHLYDLDLYILDASITTCHRRSFIMGDGEELFRLVTWLHIKRCAEESPPLQCVIMNYLPYSEMKQSYSPVYGRFVCDKSSSPCVVCLCERGVSSECPCWVGRSNLPSKLGQIGPKWEKSGTV